MVHEDTPHHSGRDGEKLGAILPRHLPLVDQPQKRFMNERRRLQGVIRPLAAKVSGRTAAKLFVQEGNESLGCGAVPVAPRPKQRRHSAS